MRRLNLVFLTVLVVGLALAGGGMYLVHGIQVRRNASALLDRARRDEAGGRLDKAEEALSWYLSLRPDDGATWAWYARLVDRGDPGRRRLERTYLVHDQALRRAGDDRELKRRAADLAMEMGRYGDARRLLAELLEGAEAGGDAKGPAGAAGRAELEDLLGQCEIGLGEHAKAEKSFQAAIGHDPQRVECYVRLARLYRTELRRNEAADVTIKQMVAKNADSGRAHALRWRYAAEFAPPADPRGIKKALELAPDDREVLVAAVMAAEQRRDMAAVRSNLEKGGRLYPQDFDLAMRLARLEAREQHLDRAEAVLRRAFELRPTAEMAFKLADNLILQGKIDVKDGAADFIARLQAAGAGDTLVRFLDAEILFQQKRWAEAIPRLEMARAVLGPEPELMLRTDFMLAECYGRQGADDQRLEALRRAAEGAQGADAAKIELVRELAQSGKLDQAISALSPLAMAGRNPQWRLDLVRLQLQQTIRMPRDRRNWAEVEGQLRAAEKAMPEAAEPLLLLRLEMLAARDRPDEARALLTQALARQPRDLGYRLAMARLAQRQGRGGEAIALIDRAEKELGPGPQIALARLDYWGRQGGDAARAAVDELAAARARVPAADRPAFLDRLGAVAIRLGRPEEARRYWRELAELRPEDMQVRLGLFDLAVATGDRDEPARLVEAIRQVEGDRGSHWRFARAALLLDQAGRGAVEGLDEARRLAAEITGSRPSWWVGPTLDGQIAELSGKPDQAIVLYMRALELGNVQPSFARRLVILLDQQGQRDKIEHVTQVLRDQGAALAEVTLVQALDAIRRRDYDRGIALARQIFPDDSPNAADHLNLGRIYLGAGKLSEAGLEFRRSVELGRGTPENWLAYVEYLVQAKQLDQARAAIEAARKALPADRATLTLARCALAVGDPSQADALLRKAMGEEGKSDDLAILRLAVEVSHRQNRLDQARQYLDRVDQAPTATPAVKAWANRTRAATLVGTGRPADRDLALSLLGRNLADDPESVEDQSLKAVILALQPADRPKAVAILERLAATNRLGDEQRFLLAELHLGQGAGAKYKDEMLGLLNRTDKDPRHLAHFVNHWIALDQLDQADRWLAELKQADPHGRPALELEARLLDLRKRRPELLALLQARGREVPDQIGAVADLLNRYRFPREAEVAYKASIARDPKQPERVLALAQFLGRQDRVPEAMEILKTAWNTWKPEQVAAVALSFYDTLPAGDAGRRQIEGWVAEVARRRPESVDFTTNLGILWIRQGRQDEAESLYRKILASNPRHARSLNNLAWLLVMRDQPRTDEALQLIERAVETEGPSPTLIDTRAVALIRAGRFDQAIEQLSMALPRAPQDASLPLHLAWALKAKGRREEARREFAKAEELGLKIQSLEPYERATVRRLREELFPG